MQLCCHAQYDSLLSVVNNPNNQDSLTAVSYFLLSDENINRNAIDSALIYSSKGIELAAKLNLEYTKGKLINQRAYINLFYNKNYPQAVNEFIEALAILDKYNDQERLIGVYLHLGIANYELKDYETALIQFKNGEELAININSKKDLGLIYINLGATLEKLDRNADAIENYLKAAAIFEGLEDKLNYSISRFNYLIVASKHFSNPKNKNKFIRFVDEYKELIPVFKKFNSNETLIHVFLNLAYEFKKTKDFNESIFYLEKADSLATNLNDLRSLVRIYAQKSQVYELKGDVVNSLKALKLHDAADDSLFSIDLSNSVADIQAKYESEKKEAENSTLKKFIRLMILAQTSEKKYKNILIFCFVISLLLVVVFYNRMRVSRSKNRIIEKQKVDLSNQKLALEEVNKEVISSINYAQRIQEALLKAKEHVSKHLPEHFVLFKPKDIVSGDFYWYLEKKGFVYIAVADCTGHGVPGAMLSMLGISYLNEINSSQELLTPGKILDLLKAKVVNELSQIDSSITVADGMDISLLRMDLKTGNLVWAGANNPLYILSNNDLTIINSTRQSIGYSDTVIPFVDHQVSHVPNAIYYLFSDGYIDQFGGSKGKKLKQSGFKKKLFEIAEQPLSAQLTVLENYFEDWKGSFDQIDDVTIIAIKAPELGG